MVRCAPQILKFRKDPVGQSGAKGSGVRETQREQRGPCGVLQREMWGCPGEARDVGRRDLCRIQRFFGGKMWQWAGRTECRMVTASFLAETAGRAEAPGQSPPDPQTTIQDVPGRCERLRQFLLLLSKLLLPQCCGVLVHQVEGTVHVF